METFTARNRARIVAILLASVANYFLTALITGAAFGVVVVLWLLGQGGDLPETGDGWRLLGVVAAVIAAIGALIALFAALVGLPSARRSLESSMLLSPSVREPDPEAHRQLVNLVDGLAIAAGIDPPPGIRIVDDPVPNAFGIGTHPSRSVVAVTSGLLATLPRQQIEAVLAYEISRVASLDVALTTWVIALSAQVTDEVGHAAVDTAVSVNRRFARRLRGWALRDSGPARDRAAVAMAKNPAALVGALERLADDPRVVAIMRPETAALWTEVPEAMVASNRAANAPELSSLPLRERIAALRELAHLPPPPQP